MKNKDPLVRVKSARRPIRGVEGGGPHPYHSGPPKNASQGGFGENDGYSGLLGTYEKKQDSCLNPWMGVDLFFEIYKTMLQSAHIRKTIDGEGNTVFHYGHSHDPVLMLLQAALVSTGLWEMIPSNPEDLDGYWARRVRDL